MKKTLRAFAAISALALLFGFASCQTGDEEPISQNTPVTPTVDKIAMNGKAYNTIKEAFAAIPSESTDTYKIVVQPGTYEELLYYTGSATIIISGDTSKKYGEDVIIRYNNSGNSNKMKEEFGLTSGYLRSVARFDKNCNVVLENLTIQNTYSRTQNDGNNTQAEALLFYSTGTLAAYNCAFKSHQDTVQTEGKTWFYNCYIEGDVDFTWIDHTANGTVALYENCVLKALGDESKNARFAAPRLTGTTPNIGKGEVFLNSTFESDTTGLTEVYIARSVAGSGDVDQVALINCQSTMTNLTSPWEKTPSMLNGVPRTIVGWKMDAASATTLNYTTSYTKGTNDYDILSSDDVAKEYSGRRAILNRVYNQPTSSFKKDSENYWDVDNLISSRRWTVSEDTSKDILEGETETSIKTWELNKETVEGLKCYNFALETGKTHYVGQTGATITIPVTKNGILTVTGYYQGNVSVKAGDQGEGIYLCSNSSTSKFVEKNYVVCNAPCDIVLTANGTSYLTKLSYEENDNINFVSVTGINLSTEKTELTAGASADLLATIEPYNATNKDITFASSDEAVAVVNKYTGEINPIAAGTVTITAKALDGSNVSATLDFTVKEASWMSAEWYSTGTSTITAAGENCDAFGTGSSSGKSLTNPTTIKNIAGETITVSGGLKLNSSGKMEITTNSSGYLTLLTVNQNAVAQPGISGKNGETATLIEGTPASNENQGKYVFALSGADTWTIDRSPATSEINPIVYARVDLSPVPSKAYEYAFSQGCEYYKAKGFSKDKFVSWDGKIGTGHGIEGGSATVMVYSGAKITLGLCQYGNGGNIIIKNGGTDVTSISQVGISACCSKRNPAVAVFDNTTSMSFTYTGEPTTLTISGYKYLEGIKIEKAE